MNLDTDSATAGLPLLQQWMQQALIFPAMTDPAQVDALITAPPHGSSADRLAIYQRSYYQRLLTCMREQFPALCHALRPELFDDFTLEYLRAHPPGSYTLYDLGRHLPEFLEVTRPDQDLPPEQRETWIDFMIDLAKFERLIFQMFDAPGAEEQKLADIDTPDDKVALQPCFHICSYGFAVGHYYHDVKTAADPKLPNALPSQYALVRKDYMTYTVAILPWQHRFLGLLMDGASIADALRQIAESEGTDVAIITEAWSNPQGLKQMWVNNGFFVKLGD